LAGGGVDVELVLGAVEDELELPFPGAVVVIDLDLHEIAAAHGLGRDLDRALGADRHLLGGEVRILRQRLGGLALRGVVGVLTVVGVGTRSLVGRLVVGPVLAGGAVGRTAVVRGSAVGAALVSGLLRGAGFVGRARAVALIGRAAAAGGQGEHERAGRHGAGRAADADG